MITNYSRLSQVYYWVPALFPNYDEWQITVKNGFSNGLFSQKSFLCPVSNNYLTPAKDLIFSKHNGRTRYFSRGKIFKVRRIGTSYIRPDKHVRWHDPMTKRKFRQLCRRYIRTRLTTCFSCLTNDSYVCTHTYCTIWIHKQLTSVITRGTIIILSLFKLAQLRWRHAGDLTHVSTR